MPTFFITEFDWSAFNAAISPPATDIAESAAKYALKHQDSACPSEFPNDRNGLAKALGKLFATNAWYANLSVDDSQRLDRLVHCIFSGDIKLKSLKPKTINNGLSLDVVDLVRGRTVIDTKRSKPRPGGTYFSPTKKENNKTPEMQHFGMRPFRHPKWDRVAAKNANPFVQPVHLPPYSIHSPEEVNQLLQEAAEGTKVLAGLKDTELTSNFEEELLRPLSQAANSRYGIYVFADY